MQKYILEKSIDVNGTDDEGCTLLLKLFALDWRNNYCYKKSIKMLQLLLQAGANPTIKDKYGYTPLEWSIKAKDIEIINVLLDTDSGVQAYNEDKKFAAHYAAKHGYISFLRKIIGHKNVAINARDKNGNTALMLADNAEIAQLLLKAGAIINIQNNYGETALSLICDNGLIMAKLLLEYEANPDLQDQEGKTALMKSCRRVQHLLLQYGADINLKDKTGRLVKEYDFHDRLDFTEVEKIDSIKKQPDLQALLMTIINKGEKALQWQELQDVSYQEKLKSIHTCYKTCLNRILFNIRLHGAWSNSLKTYKIFYDVEKFNNFIEQESKNSEIDIEAALEKHALPWHKNALREDKNKWLLSKHYYFDCNLIYK